MIKNKNLNDTPTERFMSGLSYKLSLVRNILIEEQPINENSSSFDIFQSAIDGLDKIEQAIQKFQDKKTNTACNMIDRIKIIDLDEEW